MSQWYVQRPGSSNVHGPYSLEHIRASLANGRLPESYFVHCEGRTQGWQTVADVFGLHAVPTSAPTLRVEVAPPPESAPPLPEDKPKAPDIESAIGTLNTGSGRAKLLSKQPQRGQWLLVLLDFRLQYYLTPWIIRAAWMLALLFAACQLVLMTIPLIEFPRGAAAPDELVQDRQANPLQWPPPDAKPDAAANAGRARQRIVREAAEPAEPLISPETERTIRRMCIWMLDIWIVVMGLLTTRVLCELVIVIFNIADSLIAIDRNTKGS